MSNVYRDFHDEVCENLVNGRIAKLKNGGTANQIPRFYDGTKPRLDPQPLPAAPIKKVDSWPKRIHIALPE